MCLGQAGRIRSLEEGGEALAEVDGRTRQVSLAPLVLGGDAVLVGDWVLIHAGLAVAVIHESAARELSALMDAARASEG